MPSFGERLQKSAGRLIGRFAEGSEVTLSRKSGGTYNSAERTLTGGATDSWTVSAVETACEIEEDAESQTRVVTKRFLVSADALPALPAEPGPDWEFTDEADGLTYTIVSAHPQQPGETVIYRELVVKR